MAGDRDNRIRDAVREISLLDYTENDLRKYLGPEMGDLNVKQNQGIIALVKVLRGVLLALGALNKEMNYVSADDRTLQLSFGSTKATFDRNGEIILTTGDASIRMKKDGAFDIRGKDVRVSASGAITITGFHDVIVKSTEELHLLGKRTQ